MSPPHIPLELLLGIAENIRDSQGEIRYGEFNAFLQVNRVLYSFLNRQLWQEAASQMCGTQRALTYFIQTNNEAGLSLFLERGGGRVDIEVRLPAFNMSHLDDDEFIDELFEDESLEIEPIPLLVVVSMDLVPLARILLQHGAKVEYFDSDGYGIFSPLHAARSAEMVHLLLDHHANTEITDERAIEPLYWYTLRDDIAAMQAILERGANVNPAPLRYQPLHDAAARCLATTKLLVEYGADVDAKDFNGNTPLHMAAACGLTDVVRFLLECWPEGARERGHVEGLPTPLHYAAYHGRIDVVRPLLEVWPEGKVSLNEEGQTPLEVFKSGSQFLARLLPEQDLPKIREEMCVLLGGV